MGKIKKGLGYVVAVEQYVCCALLVVMLSICFVAATRRNLSAHGNGSVL